MFLLAYFRETKFLFRIKKTYPAKMLVLSFLFCLKQLKIVSSFVYFSPMLESPVLTWASSTFCIFFRFYSINAQTLTDVWIFINCWKCAKFGKCRNWRFFPDVFLSSVIKRVCISNTGLVITHDAQCWQDSICFRLFMVTNIHSIYMCKRDG